jgi:hypothetical protein
MCLDCGCGKLHDNHGNPLHLTIGRFKLVAALNKRSLHQTALIILATLIGMINPKNPLGHDKMEGEPKRIKVEPEKTLKYAPIPKAPKRETRVKRERREEKERESSG